MKKYRPILFLFICFCVQMMMIKYAFASSLVPVPEVGITIGTAEDPTEVVASLQLLFLLSIIALAPSLLIMLTSFTRTIICLHFLRSALGTQQMPPNQVLIGLALFITLFVMTPVFNDINENAIKPYEQGLISQEQALENGMEPLRTFMIRQVEDKDISLFASLSGESYSEENPIPNSVLIPAFMLGELTTGFIFGFVIYIPFIVIDMVVASILMAMGMMMLPPAMIALPFKILLFVMIDGWSLIVETIIRTFR